MITSRHPKAITGAALGALALVCLGLILSAVTTGQSHSSPAALQSSPACLIGDQTETPVPITVEMADTDEQRRQGLMDRERLLPNTGMLFRYDTPRSADHGFWMYRTLIPLDIAYLDDSGTIVAINRMYPCPSDNPGGCPTYEAGVSFSWALEMNQGFFDENGINVGDQLSLGPVGCEE